MNAALRRLRPLVVPAGWLVALSIAAAVAATLFWRFAAPPRADLPVRIDTDPATVAQRIAGQQPFGGAPAAAPIAGAAASATAGDYGLVGVATGFAGGSAFALLKRGGGTAEPFVEGEDVATGVRLARILPDAVELDRGGRIERIEVPATPTTGIRSAGSSADGLAAPRTTSVPPREPQDSQ